ncbi:MAG: hypothetical protein H0V44_00205, partial [Planctomycetes bacterium]|nr:hypothetical protein [Planctomycetota bacterium]
MTTTIHLIFNAHLDPIWLWPWQAGLDESLATCRSACDRLDKHPDLYFSQGEAWVHAQIERCDPALFARIKAHVATGRWEIVNGWWTQPDCNQPSGFALERQIACGKEYFTSRYGVFPKIGYNIDSFGHAATLPGYMRAAGQDSYVMMRPQEHEMKLPARVFRWRGFEGGPEVTTFRIASAYAAWGTISLDHLRASLTELPADLGHTMAFVGVGDHGGGATEEQIAWCRANIDAIPGAKLVMSSPARFFAAIKDRIASLPLVTGELQQHAIGCYSVHRPVKVALRRAEHLLRQAEVVGAPAADLADAWRRVAFHHFHDTLGGTCIPSAYRQVEDQIGHIATTADEALHYGVRAQMAKLPDDLAPRVILVNASDRPFAGYLEIEPWLENDWRKGFGVIDEQGKPVAIQLMQSECLAWGPMRFVVRAEIPAGGMRILRLVKPGPAPATVAAQAGSIIANDRGCTIDPFGANARLTVGAVTLAPEFSLIDDRSDTWSHDHDRYGEHAIDTARWEDQPFVERGPLMSRVIRRGTIGASALEAEWMLYTGEESFELRLRVHWRERQRLLKLVLPLPAPASSWHAGIPGATLVRPPDGRELPVRDL